MTKQGTESGYRTVLLLFLAAIVIVGVGGILGLRSLTSDTVAFHEELARVSLRAVALPGGGRAFEVTAVSPGLFQRGGLQPGDLLLAVAGRPVNPSLPPSELFSGLLKPGPLRLKVRRNGDTISLAIPTLQPGQDDPDG